jgi:hypothetical protein
MAIRKNVKRIDPRYFLNETTNRGGLDEDARSDWEKSKRMRASTGNEEPIGPGGIPPAPGGDIHDERDPRLKGTPSPGYGPHLPVFDSLVDQAIYIVGADGKASEREPKFKQWLEQLGYKEADWAKKGYPENEFAKIKAVMKQFVSQLPDFPPEGFQGTGQSGVQAPWQLMRASKIKIPPTAGAPAGYSGGGGGGEPPPPGPGPGGPEDDPWASMPGFGGVSENKKRKRR